MKKRKRLLLLLLAVFALAVAALLWHYRVRTIGSFCPGFSAGTLLQVEGSVSPFSEETGGFVPSDDVIRFDQQSPDWARIAAFFDGFPLRRFSFSDDHADMSAAFSSGPSRSVHVRLLYREPRSGEARTTELTLFNGLGWLTLPDGGRFACRVDLGDAYELEDLFTVGWE